MGMARNTQKRKAESIIDYLKFSTKLLGIFISCSSFVAFSQDCTEKSRPVLPDDRFKIINQNIVRDNVSQLLWTRCPLGQTFIDHGCENNAGTLLTWKELENKLLQLKDNKATLHWRIPTIDELATLVETTCINPATNPTVFPLGEATTFWSNTVFSRNNNYQWIIDFSKGEQLTILQNSSNHLARLVSSEVQINSNLDEQNHSKNQLSEWQDSDIYDLNNPSLVQLQQYSEATSKLPLDQFSNIDWTKANRDGFIQPRNSIDGKGKIKEVPLAQPTIMYKNTETADWVNFTHKEHADWLVCDSCHNKNVIAINEMQETKLHTGKLCGYCHGKVAFSLEHCEKCHNTAKIQ